MSILKVPGAHLYYETLGSGPVMVMAPGASGTAEGFRRAAKYLAASYTVAVYDRRGFSRSRLEGPQDFGRRLETDADDLRRLVECLSDEPATLFGVSSGAIVVLEVLIRHPAVVGTLVAFEPPTVRLLSDGHTWVDFFHEVYDLYHRSGVEPALQQFREKTFAVSDRAAMARAMDLNAGDQMLANLAYWFEHELRQYPTTILKLDPLRTYADRIVLAAGRDSHGYPCREATIELGKQLGRQVIDFPGGHVGCMSQPADFAGELMRALIDRAV
ncbi:alpha/beta fold hydrolase [Nonomuraea insulae]|uniref:Alpha/beta fold hydrolase n=1 Tax=Nonomuraea insulae TaxID=1616787 RepID=A0ABW1CER2_9ACTN